MVRLIRKQKINALDLKVRGEEVAPQDSSFRPHPPPTETSPPSYFFAFFGGSNIWGEIIFWSTGLLGTAKKNLQYEPARVVLLQWRPCKGLAAKRKLQNGGGVGGLLLFAFLFSRGAKQTLELRKNIGLPVTRLAANSIFFQN